MEDLVREVVGKAKADFAEVRWEKVFRSRVVFQRNQLMALEATEEGGGIVRALVNGAWGLAVFTDPEELPQKIDEAVHLARTASRHVHDKVALAEVEPVEDRYQGPMERDIRGVPLEEKRKLAETYNKIILGFHPAIVASSVRYADSLRHVVYANSEGTYIEQEIPDVTLMLAALARKNGDVQQGFESLGFSGGFEKALGHEDRARIAAKRAVDLLSAKPVKGGRYPVILNQELAGVFIHEAFGHICEADFLLRNEPMRKVMELGKRFGVENLNVVDDGFIPGARGNCPYDDEGYGGSGSTSSKKDCSRALCTPGPQPKSSVQNPRGTPALSPGNMSPSCACVTPSSNQALIHSRKCSMALTTEFMHAERSAGKRSSNSSRSPRLMATRSWMENSGKWSATWS
jgi:TldD protein